MGQLGFEKRGRAVESLAFSMSHPKKNPWTEPDSWKRPNHKQRRVETPPKIRHRIDCTTIFRDVTELFFATVRGCTAGSFAPSALFLWSRQLPISISSHLAMYDNGPFGLILHILASTGGRETWRMLPARPSPHKTRSWKLWNWILISTGGKGRASHLRRLRHEN